VNEPWLSEEQIDSLIDLALAEDISQGDVTSEAIIPPDLHGKASIMVKANGVLAGGATGTLGAETDGPLRIGTSGTCHFHGRGFGGLLDEVAIYDRALTSEEIQQHYQNGLNGIGYLGIHVEIDIKPETLNLKSKGVFTAFIELPECYCEEDVDIGTVECEGASALRVVMADDGRLIVKFDRKDLVGVSPGDAVELTVTGQLTNGTPFAGSDTIRVIDRGGGKK